MLTCKQYVLCKSVALLKLPLTYSHSTWAFTREWLMSIAIYTSGSD